MSQGTDKFPIDEFEDQVEYVSPVVLRQQVKQQSLVIEVLKKDLQQARDLVDYMRNKARLEASGRPYKPSDLLDGVSFYKDTFEWTNQIHANNKAFYTNPQPGQSSAAIGNYWKQLHAKPPTANPKKKLP